MRVTMEDIGLSFFLLLFAVFLYQQGIINEIWGITLVAFGLLMILFKCKLDKCYLTRGKVIYER